jgi:hypothetical protein
MLTAAWMCLKPYWESAGQRSSRQLTRLCKGTSSAVCTFPCQGAL